MLVEWVFWGLGLGRGILRKAVPEAGLWTPECEDTGPGPSGFAHGHLLSCDFPVCSCALQRDLLLQGRLYISPNWLCFHASLFGKDIKVVISGKGCSGPHEAAARKETGPLPYGCQALGEVCH